MRARLPFRAPARAAGEAAPVVPPDPRRAIAGPLDPTLLAIRSGLVPHRRRLWLRRIVRRTWIALAAVVVAELLLWTVARFVALEFAPVIGVAIPVIGLIALIAAVIHARPSIGEAALAVDAEGRLGDRVSSAPRAGGRVPGVRRPRPIWKRMIRPAGRRFGRRRAVRPAPAARRAHGLAGRPSEPVPASVLARPLPSPSCRACARAGAADREPAGRCHRHEPARPRGSQPAGRADRGDRAGPRSKGDRTDDPRDQLAEELRELARQLREQPGELNDNLARVAASKPGSAASSILRTSSGRRR